MKKDHRNGDPEEDVERRDPWAHVLTREAIQVDDQQYRKDPREPAPHRLSQRKRASARAGKDRLRSSDFVGTRRVPTQLSECAVYQSSKRPRTGATPVPNRNRRPS